MSGALLDSPIARTLRSAAACAVPIAVLLALAACGSNGSASGASRSGTKPTGGTAPGSATEPTGTHGNGVASKPPLQIIAAAQTALRSASGFVVGGTLRQGGKTVRLKIVEGGATGLDVRMAGQGKSAEIIALPKAAYVRANQAYLKAQAGAGAAGLANRWIELPASASAQFTSGFGPFAPDTLARCLGENLGRLSRDGTTTVNGRPAVVLRQAGNVPGSNPGTLAVATNGPPYPLRVTSTGPTRPGGKVDACNTGKGGDVEGSMTLSDFNHAPAITAPTHPVKPGTSQSSSA